MKENEKSSPGHPLVHPNQIFERMAEPFRRELKFHCYRMLGSVHDAEDLIQETYLRAWRAFDRFDGRGSFRSWLYTIATNACLNALASRKNNKTFTRPARTSHSKDVQQYLGAPATELSWLEPYPDQFLEGIADDTPIRSRDIESREAVGLHSSPQFNLSPRQRAMLLLCDVLGWSAAETARFLGGTTASRGSHSSALEIPFPSDICPDNANQHHWRMQQRRG